MKNFEKYKDKLLDKNQLTHDEYVILKNINKDYKWIGRCMAKNSFTFASTKPYKSIGIWECDMNMKIVHGLFNNIFEFISWDDEEPFYIPRLIKDYEKEHEDDSC